MGPIESMIHSVVGKKMLEDFPQVQLPAIMKAKVTKAAEREEYEQDGIKIENMDEGITFEAKMTGKWYEYNLKILTKEGDTDSRFPEIPAVQSPIRLKTGTVVAVALLYGELIPCILSEVR